ncbi:hypothetical protein NL676_009174 [Syzygium grande]|nr:hypothetical protein NL676_009174 [Syzygium grande]
MQAFRRLNSQQFFDTRVKPLLTDSILFRCKHRYTSLNPEQFPYFVSSRSTPCQSCFTQNFVEHLKQYFQRTPTVSFSGLLRAVGTAKRQERSGASWYRQETNRKYRHYYNSLLGNWSSESYKQARQGSSDSDAKLDRLNKFFRAWISLLSAMQLGLLLYSRSLIEMFRRRLDAQHAVVRPVSDVHPQSIAWAAMTADVKARNCYMDIDSVPKDFFMPKGPTRGVEAKWIEAKIDKQAYRAVVAGDTRR